MTKNGVPFYKGFLMYLFTSERGLNCVEIYDSNNQFRDATTESAASGEAKFIEAKNIIDRIVQKEG